MSEYTQLKHFENKHEGKKAFVCGSGTSLSLMPINLADYGIVICVNASGLHFSRYQYLFVTDPAVLEMAYWDEVLAKADTVIFASSLFEDWFENGNIYTHVPENKTKYLLTRSYEDHQAYNFAGMNKLCLGYDAPVPATHFAYAIGCRPIVLCGVDMCFSKEGSRYFTQEAFKHKETSPFAESFAVGFEKAKIHTQHGPSDTILQQALPIWGHIWNQNPGIEEIIFNASPISVIPNFRKVDIKEML